MNEHMNIFMPYQRKHEQHEDHLTRGFLLLLKYCPSAFYTFYDYVREAYHDLDFDATKCDMGNLFLTDFEANITTQVGCKNAIDYLTPRVLSILITDKNLEYTPEKLNNNHRCAIYDGVISINNEWTFIVENKPYNQNVWAKQLSPGGKLYEVINNEEINLVSKPIQLQWKEIFTRLNNLKCTDFEKMFIQDFCDFVFRNYPTLFPYETFKQCNNNRQLLDLRIEKLLKTITSEDIVKYHSNWANTIRINKECINQIDYRPNCDMKAIDLCFFYGTTIPTSKNLFTTDIRNIKSLKGFHYQYHIRIADNYGRQIYSIRCKKDCINEFISYWQKNTGKICQTPRDYLLNIVKNEFQGLPWLEEIDLEALKLAIGSRTILRIIPQIDLIYKFPLEQIYKLEKEGTLELEFIKKSIEGLSMVNCEDTFDNLLQPQFKILEKNVKTK